jgi:hypothetical protein
MFVDAYRNSEEGARVNAARTVNGVYSINIATSKHSCARKCDLPVSIQLPALQVYQPP